MTWQDTSFLFLVLFSGSVLSLEKNVSGLDLPLCNASRGHSQPPLYVIAKFGNGGWNNQRQQLFAAAWVAKVLQRPLLVPKTFHASKHSSKKILVESVFDISALRNFIDVEIGELPVKQPLLQLQLNPHCYDITPDQLCRAAAPSRNSHIALMVPWVYIDYTFRFTDLAVSGTNPTGEKKTLIQAFKLQTTYRDCATAVLNYLTPSCSGGLHSAHLRVMDRRPLPLFNCSRGFEVFGKQLVSSVSREQYCIDSSRSILTIAEVIEKDQEQKLGPESCIFVATNNVKDKNVVGFRKWIEAHSGAKVFFFDDIRKQLPTDNCHVLDVSIMEQAIAADIPGSYVATFPSSWDEFVVNLRAMYGGKWRATEEVALFNYKVRKMLSVDLREAQAKGGRCWVLRKK
jgi:hypothetical protein